MLQSLLNGVISGCQFGLVAIGLALVYQVRGFFHVAHGAVYLTGAYVANVLIADHQWPAFAGIPSAILAGVLLGLTMEVAIYRPLARRGASATILLIASLGILIVVQNVIALTFGSFSRTFFGQGVQEGFTLWSLRVTRVQMISVTAFALIGAILWVWMFKTRSGKTVRAVADNPELGIAFGIDSDRVILLVFAVASGLAAVAGILAGYDTNVYPSMGFWGILPPVVAIVVGGLGSISGALAGAMFVGIVQNLAAWFLPAIWTNAILFMVLFAFLLIRPSGMIGAPLPRPRI
jgi:branched-subunit amino acid ABC-type transport system permease component